MMPDAAELARLRDDLNNAILPDTADILTVTDTADGQGGVTQSWGTATAMVACRIDPMTSREILAGGGVADFHGYMITLPHDITITARNRVKINAVEYNVITVTASQSWGACVRVKAERV